MIEQHLLLIPPTGLLEVIHTEKQVDVEETLRRRCNDCTGAFMSVNLDLNGTYAGKVEWLLDPDGPENPRAREALAMLAGIHMILTHYVLFSDVEPEKVYQIVAHLSRKE